MSSTGIVRPRLDSTDLGEGLIPPEDRSFLRCNNTFILVTSTNSSHVEDILEIWTLEFDNPIISPFDEQLKDSDLPCLYLQHQLAEESARWMHSQSS